MKQQTKRNRPAIASLTILALLTAATALLLLATVLPMPRPLATDARLAAARSIDAQHGARMVGHTAYVATVR